MVRKWMPHIVQLSTGLKKNHEYIEKPSALRNPMLQKKAQIISQGTDRQNP